MILSAAEISLPTGNLSNGVYDSLGNYYQLPEWAVSDPQNVQEDQAPGAKGDVSTAGEDTAADEELTDDEIDGKKQEKGKEVDEPKELVKLRARLSENGQDINVNISESETVRSVAKKIALEAGVSTFTLINSSIEQTERGKSRMLTWLSACFYKEDQNRLYGQDPQG